jgi:hypothetical protein
MCYRYFDFKYNLFDLFETTIMAYGYGAMSLSINGVFEKVLGKCCQQDRLVITSAHEIFSNFIMFVAFVDGWHSVSHDPVFSYNEKYKTDWTCR